MATNVTLYQMLDGRITPTVTGKTTENCHAAFAARGFQHVRDNFNPRHRAELQGAPVFEGVIGPMWDGKNGIRYEDAEVYRTMSA